MLLHLEKIKTAEFIDVLFYYDGVRAYLTPYDNGTLFFMWHTMEDVRGEHNGYTFLDVWFVTFFEENLNECKLKHFGISSEFTNNKIRRLFSSRPCFVVKTDVESNVKSVENTSWDNIKKEFMVAKK